MIHRSILKDWTEILTPWIQIVGLLAAGTFALVEYRESQRNVQVQRAFDYLSRQYSPDFVKARLKLARREDETDSLSNKILRELSGDRLNVTYYHFVVDKVIMPGTGQGLDSSFQFILGFLDESVICS